MIFCTVCVVSGFVIAWAGCSGWVLLLSSALIGIFLLWSWLTDGVDGTTALVFGGFGLFLHQAAFLFTAVLVGETRGASQLSNQSQTPHKAPSPSCAIVEDAANN
jgi:hypothetical protein